MPFERCLEDKLKNALKERGVAHQAVAGATVLYQNKARDFSIVQRVIDSLKYLPDLSKVYLAIVDVVVSETEAENCSLMLLDRDGNELVVKVAMGKKDNTGRYYGDKSHSGKRLALGTGIAGMVAQEGKPLLIEDTRKEKRFVNLDDSGIDVRSLLCVPIMDKDAVIGVFNLSHSRAGAFCDNDLVILDIISSLAVTALTSAGLFESLQYLNKTLEKKVEDETKKVKAYEGKYRALVKNANDGIFIVEDGVFRYTNRKFQEMMGYSAEELSSNSFKMVFSHDELGLFFHRMNGEVEKDKLPSHYELTVIQKGGAELEVEISTAAIDYEGDKAIQGIVRDITPRKELERLKSNFLAMAAHELRSPLVMISGYNKMLLNEEVGALNDFQKKILKDCIKSGKRLNNFANEVLELSKIEAGRMDFEFKETDVGDCIENGVKQVKYIARKKRIELKRNLPQDLPSLSLDKNKIEQVMINLIENAIRFSPEEGKIAIEAKLVSPDVVEVSVIDHGQGIPHEEMDIIFDEFMVGKKIMNRKGTGLGLAICKKIVEAHKGRIWVESWEDKGSKFTFALPVARSMQEITY